MNKHAQIDKRRLRDSSARHYRHLTAVAICGLLGFSSVASEAKTAIPRHPRKLEYAALDWEIPLGAPYRVTLENGLRLYIAEDHSLPLIEIKGYVRTGSMLDPKGKEGLGALATRLMRTGGSERFSPDTLDALVERLAMNISFNLTESHLEFDASFLSEYADTGFMLLEQMLFYPAYDSGRVEKERQLLIQSIKHRFDNPEPTLAAAYEKVMYPGQPNSRLATEQSAAAITRDDLLAFHQRAIRTEQTVVAASGDFDAKSVKAQLTETFPPADTAAAPVAFPDITIDPGSTLTLVHKPISQAYVRIGLPLFARPHPDYYPMSLVNLILGGGGFTSRLATRVRSDEGLTYSIYSHAGSNYTYPATLYINFFTKHQTANRAIAIILEELERFLEKGITDAELHNARQVMIEGLPSSFRSPADIVETYAWNEFYGRSDDHYRVYPDKLRALTKKDLMAAAKKHLNPEALTYVVVGDTTKILNGDGARGFSLSAIRDRVVLTPEELASPAPVTAKESDAVQEAAK